MAKKIQQFKKVTILKLFILLFLLNSSKTFSQINIEGKYNFQWASKGVLHKNDGTTEIKALGDGRYEYKESFNGFKPDISYFTLDGNKIKFENGSDVKRAEFKENGNIIYLVIVNTNYVSYAQLAIKEGAVTKMKSLSQEIINETKKTRKCPCCAIEYNKLEGFFRYKEGNNYYVYTEKQDILQKGKGKYACSEKCAENFFFNKCKK
jgi:hypothetical protein